MKTKVKLMMFSAAMIAAVLCSCDGPNDPVPLANTRDSFSNPEPIGSLPDGRVVKCIRRDRGADHDHFIYFIDNGDGGATTSTNTSVSAGKTTVNQVTVEIDGVKYVPLEKP